MKMILNLLFLLSAFTQVAHAGEEKVKLYVVAYYSKSTPEASLALYKLHKLKYSSIEVFQKEHDLKVDGYIGKKTKKKIEKIYGAKMPHLVVEKNKEFISFYDTLSKFSILKNVSKSNVHIGGLLTYHATKGFSMNDIVIDNYRGFSVKDGDMIKLMRVDLPDKIMKKGSSFKSGEYLVKATDLHSRYSLGGDVILIKE